MTSVPRKQLFVDRKVQGALMLRVVLYWFASLLTVTSMVLIWRVIVGGPGKSMLSHAEELWTQFAPAFVSAQLVLLLALIDSVRMSNRFVGPLCRVRGALRRLAAGEQVEPLRFREGDFWADLAGEVNQVAARFGHVRNSPSSPANPTSPTNEPVTAR